ncbi:hypothetical protein RHGRI_037892 [Rhododendron griersonianum]|uniref:Uncharacterized protein n=1 Tax=Rhododendron griersonianum TaxID=479676 RepID=A0AAV6HU00_9ERIC|nr:hypothetical protein RHGRI_037892 [Rhododendron griersonianum]
MCNPSDQSCPKVTSGGGGGGGGAVGQQDVFLLLQPLRPPPQYFFFPPATSTTTAPPFQHRLETTSQQLVGTNSSNNSSSSTSSNVRFVHGARYLQNLYPYCYARNGHGIRKQPQLCYPVVNPASYAMASAAELNKKRLRVDGDQNGIVHTNSANTNAVYPNSSRPIPSTSTRSLATINFAESLSPSSSGPGPGGGLYCTNMLTGSKRKRDDNMDRFESKESTEIDLELKL